MAVTKEDWKDVGRGFKGAFKTLGKSVVKTVKTGVDKAGEWAEGDCAKTEEKPAAKAVAAEAETAPAEETKAE